MESSASFLLFPLPPFCLNVSFSPFFPFSVFPLGVPFDLLFLPFFFAFFLFFRSFSRFYVGDSPRARNKKTQDAKNVLRFSKLSGERRRGLDDGFESQILAFARRIKIVRSFAGRGARGDRSARFANRSGADRSARSANRLAEANLQATEFLDEAGLLADDRSARFANRSGADRFARSDGFANRSDRFARGDGFASRSARSAFDGADRFAAREASREAGFRALNGADGLDDGGFQSEARTNARNADRSGASRSARFANRNVANRGARGDRSARGDGGGFRSRSGRSGVLSENVRGSESEDDRKKDTSLHL